MPILYRNVFIVVQVDHKCGTKSSVHCLIRGRKSILHMISNLELSMQGAIIIPPMSIVREDPDTLCRLSMSPDIFFSKLGSALPNLKNIGWTVGVVDDYFSYANAIEHEQRDIGRHFLRSCYTLEQIINCSPPWAQRISHFRLWLPEETCSTLGAFTRYWNPQPQIEEESVKSLSELASYAAFEVLLELPNLRQLDIFFFTDVSLWWNYYHYHYRQPCEPTYNLRSNPTFATQEARGAENMPEFDPFAEREQQVMGHLLHLLEFTFQHVPALRFWRISYGGVLENAYESFGF